MANMLKTKVKLKACRQCKAKFEPRNSLQVVCSLDCAKLIGQKKTVRDAKTAQMAQKRELIKEKQANRKRLLELQSLGYFKGKAQDALNKWVTHARDKDRPCISCGKHKRYYDAGHYLARSIRPELALTEININKQCVYCNQYSKNAHHAYRVALIEKIGLDKVELLEGPHEPAKWSKQDLIDTEKKYKELLKNDRPR